MLPFKHDTHTHAHAFPAALRPHCGFLLQISCPWSSIARWAIPAPQPLQKVSFVVSSKKLCLNFIFCTCRTPEQFLSQGESAPLKDQVYFNPMKGVPVPSPHPSSKLAQVSLSSLSKQLAIALEKLFHPRRF